MATKINASRYRHAQQLIEDGLYVLDDRDAWSEHRPSARQENTFIEQAASANAGDGRHRDGRSPPARNVGRAEAGLNPVWWQAFSRDVRPRDRRDLPSEHRAAEPLLPGSVGRPVRRGGPCRRDAGRRTPGAQRRPEARRGAGNLSIRAVGPHRELVQQRSATHG